MNGPALKVLGRYELQAELGRGMMGVVYKALDPALHRVVALKTVRLASSLPEDQRQLFEKRFLAEARAAAGLSHPGIVVVHDVGRDTESRTLYIALEFLQGRTLAEVTAGSTPLDWREALRIAGRLAEALYHAHAQGIVHRDVKPANVMILPSGEPKLMDFGIAKVPASQLTAAGAFFGTPLYMSPEQAAGEVVDSRSDLFSLGSVLYLLLTGRRAFDAENVPAILARVSRLDPPPPTRLRPGLPGDVDYVVMRALAKDRTRRYPDGRMLAEDIEDVLQGRAPRHRGGWVAAPPEGDTRSAAPSQAASESARHSTPVASGLTPSRNLVFRLADRLSRRNLLALGGLLFLGVLAALLIPRGEQTSLSLPFGEPGHLEITFEHSLKYGSLKAWVDDELVLDEPLESRVTKKVLSLRFRKGSVNQVLDVSPGEHLVRVQVEGDYNATRRIRGTFERGVTKRLEVRVGGLLKKELSLDWAP